MGALLPTTDKITRIIHSEQSLQKDQKNPSDVRKLRANPEFRRANTSQPTHSFDFPAKTSAISAEQVT